MPFNIKIFDFGRAGDSVDGWRDNPVVGVGAGRCSHSECECYAADGDGFAESLAAGELAFEVAELGFAFGAGAFSVAFMFTFGDDEFDIVLLGDLSSDLFEYFTAVFSFHL